MNDRMLHSPALLALMLCVAPPLGFVAGHAAMPQKAPAAGQVPAKPATRASAPPIVIKGGTVFTITKGTIPNGTVVIRDGRIAAVGANIEVPAGAEVVDATGRFVTPGIVDQHSHIAEDSTNEAGTTVSSMTNIIDVLDPSDVNIYRDLAGGLTVANVLHGSANRSAERTRSSSCAGAGSAPRIWCSTPACRASSSPSARTRKTCLGAARHRPARAGTR